MNQKLRLLIHSDDFDLETERAAGEGMIEVEDGSLVFDFVDADREDSALGILDAEDGAFEAVGFWDGVEIDFAERVGYDRAVGVFGRQEDLVALADL